MELLKGVSELYMQSCVMGAPSPDRGCGAGTREGLLEKGKLSHEAK